MKKLELKQMEDLQGGFAWGRAECTLGMGATFAAAATGNLFGVFMGLAFVSSQSCYTGKLF